MRRKTTPRVRDGRVQKKNNWRATVSPEQPFPEFRRVRPRAGDRHLLGRRDLERFISILPDWDELSRGLREVVLAADDDAMGFHAPGSVSICAWRADLWWQDAKPEFVEEHRAIFERLGVEIDKTGDRIVVRWTEAQARAFQLLHVFLHELGHHHDCVRTRSRRAAARGESYAEAYA